jgi:hypothetical protein
MSLKKNPLTPSGIEHATFRLVAQCFTQMRTPPKPVGDYNNQYRYCKRSTASGIFMYTNQCKSTAYILNPINNHKHSLHVAAIRRPEGHVNTRQYVISNTSVFTCKVLKIHTDSYEYYGYYTATHILQWN